MQQQPIQAVPSVIIDVNIPFGRLVMLILKFALASIPASVVLYIILYIVAYAMRGLLN